MRKIFFQIVLLIVFVCSPAFAGESIYYSHLTDGFWQIWKMDPDGKGQQQITKSLWDKRELSYQKRNLKIVYSTPNGEIFLMNLDGSDEIEVLPQFKPMANPSLFPNSNELIFVRYDPRSKEITDIWTSNIDGRNTKVLTKDTQFKYQPNLSSQGDRVVFVKSDLDKKNHHLWLMDADGSNPRQLTKGVGFDTLPVFSHDGKSVVFTSNRGEKSYDLYQVDIKSGKIKQLTDDAGLDTSASLSKDDQNLVFVSNRSGIQQIWSMVLKTKKLTQLTQSDTESIDPIFVDWK